MGFHRRSILGALPGTWNLRGTGTLLRIPDLQRALAIAVAVLLSRPVACLAAQQALEVPEVVVEGQAPRFAQQPQDVTVVSRGEIERSGATTLADLLQHQPGVFLLRYGPAGSLVTASLRGAPGEGVLVLRDGVRLTDPQTGSTDLSGVSLLGVDHVEILRGGASALYGSDAVGGVIDLISGAPPTELDTEVGSYGDARLGLQLGAGKGVAQEAAAFQGETAANDFPTFYRGAQILRANSQFHAAGAWFRVARPVGSGSFAAQLLYGHDDRGAPGPINQPSPLADQQDESLLGSLRYDLGRKGAFEPVIELSHRHGSLAYTDPQTAFGPPSTLGMTETTHLRVSTGYDRSIHDLRFGAGLTRQAVTASGIGFKTDWIGSLFAADDLFAFERAPLSLGLRLDEDSRWGLSVNPRLGVTVNATPWLRFRSEIGHSFRAPSFNDLYWPASSDAAGNPALRPEQSVSGEVGLDVADRAMSDLAASDLALTGFVADGWDAIVWEPGTGGRWSPINLGRTWTQGLEARSTVRLPASASLQVHGTWQSAVDAASTGDTAGKQLPFRPGILAGVTLGWQPVGPLEGQVSWDYTGPRFDTAADTESLPGFGLLSARASYALTPSDTLRLGGDNLLNTYYVLEPYYPMPGLTLWAEWSRRF